MDRAIFDELQQAGQYTRLDLMQQHIGQLQSWDIEFLIQRVLSIADQGDLKTAIGMADVAVLCAVALDDHIALAKALTVQARVLFAFGDNRRGIRCSLQALNLLRQHHKTRDEFRDFFEEHGLEFGVALVEEKVALGLNASAAIQMLDDVERIYERYGYELGLGYLNFAKGDAFRETFRLEDALIRYMRALPILRKHKMHIAELLLNTCSVCMALNQVDEAAGYLDKAKSIFEEEKNELGLAAIYVNKAALLRRRRQFRDLVRLYRQASEIYQRHDQVQDVAFVDMNLATLLAIYPGHLEQSVAFLEPALATFEESGSKRLAAKARGYLAVLCAHMGTRERAKELLVRLVKENHAEVPTDTLWQAYYILGHLELAEGDLEEAYQYHQDALRIIDSMRMYLRTEELLIDILKLKPDFYGPLVHLAKRLGKQVEAISWVEQARSRAFLHLLGNVRLVSADEDTALLGRIDHLDAKIALLRKNIDERTPLESPEVISKWQQAWQEAIPAREALRRRLKIRNAEAASMVTVQPLDWDEIRILLSSR